MKPLSLVPLLLVGVLVAGCGSDGRTDRDADGVTGAGSGSGADQAGGNAAKLDGTTYVVTRATDGGAPHSFVTGSEVRLSFADGRLSISAGCNQMSGGYALDGTTLSLTEGLMQTDMGCSTPLMDQDAWVAGLFDDRVELVGGQKAR